MNIFNCGFVHEFETCHLKITNLDALVTICKKWPNDVREGCSFVACSTIGEFYSTKIKLLNEHEDELKEVEYF